SDGFFASLDTFYWVLIGLGAAGLLFGGLAFVFPPLAFVPLVLGLLAMVAGGIWFLVIAFSDEVMHGILCLLCNLYSLYYLVTHFDECKNPFFLQLAGFALYMFAACAGGFGASLWGM